MTVGQLKDYLHDYADSLEVVRIDNSGGYEKIYSVLDVEVYDNFSDDKKIVVALD